MELIVRIDPNLPDMLIGDVGRIRQIITNLVGNAVKFTENGHIYINASAVDCDDDGKQTVRIEVIDTGIGIPKDAQKKIFGKFSQVDTSACRKHEGTGLGLSISSSLVELMCGKIGVESATGEGSTFWIELGLEMFDEVVPGKKRIPIDVSGSNILIVDDNEVNRSILSEQMAAWRFESAAVESGQDALAVMKLAQKQNLNIDCIVLDYHMPEMNGGDVVEAMRQDPEIEDLPILMLTSVNETQDKKAFSSLGIQGHLVKPTRSSILLETLIEVLQNAKAQTEATLSKNVEKAVSVVTKSLDEEQTYTAPNIESLPEEPAEDVSSLVAEIPKQEEVQQNAPGGYAGEAGVDVLVCEDNEVNQIVFTQVLETVGVSYKIANNGEEGVAAYEELSPRMILMDVSMPVMNGHEATQAIREIEAQENRRRTPIMAVTAHAIKGDSDKCFAAGMDDYLSKPISPNSLTEKIHKWLEMEAPGEAVQ